MKGFKKFFHKSSSSQSSPLGGQPAGQELPAARAIAADTTNILSQHRPSTSADSNFSLNIHHQQPCPQFQSRRSLQISPPLTYSLTKSSHVQKSPAAAIQHATSHALSHGATTTTFLEGEEGNGSPSDSFKVTSASSPKVTTSSSCPSLHRNQNVQLFRDQGDICTMQGDYNKAVVFYEAAATHSDNNTELLLVLAISRFMCTPPQLEIALEEVNSVLEREPDNIAAFRTKGEVCERLGRFEEAENALMTATQWSTGPERVKVMQALVSLRTKKLAQPDTAPVLAETSPAAAMRQRTFPLSGIKFIDTASTLSTPQDTSPSAVSTSATSATSTALQVPTTSSAAINSAFATKIPILTSNTTQLTLEPINSNSLPTSDFNSSPHNLQPSSTYPEPDIESHRILNASIIEPPAATTDPTVIDSKAISRNQLGSQQKQYDSGAQWPHDVTISSAARVRNLAIGVDIVDNISTEPELPDNSAKVSSSTTTTIYELELRPHNFNNHFVMKSRGSLFLRPYASPREFDAIQLTSVELDSGELTVRKEPQPTYVHPAHAIMTVPASDYAGNNLIDTDPEAAPTFDGMITGTCSISGYNEEYRESQLRKRPLLLNLHLEAGVGLPRIALSEIVDRIRKLRVELVEDDANLKTLLGLPRPLLISYGFGPDGTNQKRIDSLCLLLSRAHFDEPARFPNFCFRSQFSFSFFLTSRAQETVTRDFLYQILLGAELLVRLRKQSVETSYRGIMTHYISTLVFCASLFMANVIILGPSSPPVEGNMNEAPALPVYSFASRAYARQAQALLEFGQAISWPFMDQASRHIKSAYNNLTCGKPIHEYLIDWLFGLSLPGKYYRRLIMCCLVLSCSSTKHLGASSFFDSGISVLGKSYWPKRSVLGRVLGGLRNTRQICGWVGPVPSPCFLHQDDTTKESTSDGGTMSDMQGWFLLYAKKVNITVPVTKIARKKSFSDLKFDNSIGRANGTAQMLSTPKDMVHWIIPTPPPPPPANYGPTQLKTLLLKKLPSISRGTDSTTKEYRAILDFNIRGVCVKYTLYYNPIFVTAPACAGEHVLHDQQARLHIANTVTVEQLKDVHLADGKLLVINSQGEGDEIVARAWCAEKGKNAVIRRNMAGLECCFACACTIAAKPMGLGFGILIWAL